MKKKLTPTQAEELMSTLRTRFDKHMSRHPSLKWTDARASLEVHPGKLWSLSEMEASGGEPDVVGYDERSGEYHFMDCSAETPKGRVSVCYDREGLESRKEHKPRTSAQEMATEMGVTLLTEEQYQQLQAIGEFDKKTSSWVQTPADIRKAGGALYCERRYGRILVGHNGAQSYYGVRGFRGLLCV